MTVRVGQTFNEAAFETPVKHHDQTTHWHQRCIQWIDGYFHLGTEGTEVRLQPLWLTILKIVSYATLIIPAILLCAKWVLRTVYPFPICTQISPDVNDVPIETEKKVYVNPKLLLQEDLLTGYFESENDQDYGVNFADVTIDGKPTIIPVQEKKGTNTYVPCKEPAVFILLKMIEEDESILDLVLDHPHQGRLREEFYAFLFSPDEHNQVTITTLSFENPAPLLRIIKYAGEHSIPIAEDIVDELFVQWAGLGYPELTELLLNLHPGAIKKTDAENSFFSGAALNGSSREIEILLKAMNDQHISLTPSEVWLHKAYANDCDFTKEEFLALDEELRNEIYEAANVFMRYAFLLKLRIYGIKEQEVLPPKKANLFSPNMDALDVERAVYDFLEQLREQKALLTEEEFEQMGLHQFQELGYRRMSSILANHYMQRTAEELGLNYIKFQKSIAVFRPRDKKKQTIDIEIGAWGSLPIAWASFPITSNDLTIYLENITPIERYATKEEMLGLLNLLEKTGYHFSPIRKQIFVGKNSEGEEGLFFKTVSYPQIKLKPDYSHMDTLLELMAEENHAWLRAEIREREERYGREETGVDAEDECEECEKRQAIRHGFNIVRNMQVPIGDFIS